MNESKKPLLIAKASQNLSLAKMKEIHNYLKPQVEHLGMNLLVVDESVDAQVHQPISDLIEAIKSQTEAINNLVGSNIAILDELIAQDDAHDEIDLDAQSPTLD